MAQSPVVDEGLGKRPMWSSGRRASLSSTRPATHPYPAGTWGGSSRIRGETHCTRLHHGIREGARWRRDPRARASRLGFAPRGRGGEEVIWGLTCGRWRPWARPGAAVPAPGRPPTVRCSVAGRVVGTWPAELAGPELTEPLDRAAYRYLHSGSCRAATSVYPTWRAFCSAPIGGSGPTTGERRTTGSCRPDEAASGQRLAARPYRVFMRRENERVGQSARTRWRVLPASDGRSELAAAEYWSTLAYRSVRGRQPPPGAVD